MEIEKMTTMKWKTERRMFMQNSYGVIPGSVDTVVMRLTMWLDEDRCRGGFEWYDEETGGERYYAEGGIWLTEDAKLSDYDGVSSLPPEIVRYLHENNHLGEWDTNYYTKRGLI
jgi:hypothetical protein